MENIKEKNYGFLEPVVKEKDYLFGDAQLPFDELQKDGDWTDYLPTEESQFSNEKLFETNTCTIFGTNNCLETLERRKYGGNPDYSDRELAIASGMDWRQGGADPNVIIETARTKGLTGQEVLPNFDDSVKTTDDFFKPKPLPQTIIDKAKSWLDIFQVGHDWVAKGNLVSTGVLREALKHSPLGVAVFSWANDGTYYFRPDGEKDGHWVLLYKVNDNGTFEIFDSYAPYKKTLRSDFRFYWVKRFSIDKKITETEKIGFLEQIRNALASFVQFLTNFIKKNPVSQPEVEVEKSPVVQENPPVVVVDPIEPKKPPEPATTPNPTYLWDTKENIKTSIKKIAVEMGIDPELACRVAQCESALNPNAKGINTNKTIDRGLYQFSNYWYKNVSDECAFNPECATRVFCKVVKNGRLKDWNSSKSCWNVV